MAFRQVHAHSPDCPVRAFFTRGIVFPAHWHEDVELVVLLRGRMELFLDGDRIVLNPGDGVLAAPRAIHAYNGVGGMGVILIFPPLASVPTGVSDAVVPPVRSRLLRAGTVGVAGDTSLIDLATLGAHVARSPVAELPGKALILAGLAAVLRGLFVSNEPHGGASSGAAESTALRGDPHAAAASPESRIRRALAYLEDHFADHVTISAAAAAAGLSPWYFSRLFPRLTGNRFVDWVAARRLAEAERLLTDSDLSVTEIADESGFGGIRALDRAFRKRRGMSPRSFRLRSSVSPPVLPTPDNG